MTDTNELERKLLKIQRKPKLWIVDYLNEDGNEIRFTSEHEPHGDLIRAFEDLQPFACEATPYLAKDFHEHSDVTHVEFDWKNNRRNCMMIMMVKAGSDGLKPVRSQKRLADLDMDEAIKGRWSEEAVRQIDIMEMEAFEFVEGARAAPPLPLTERGEEEQLSEGIDDNEFEDQT